MESCGLKNGSLIHVLKKKDLKVNATVKPEHNIETLTSVFKSFIGNSLLELALRVRGIKQLNNFNCMMS